MRIQGLALALLAGCLEPTQVTFDIKTDVPCEEVSGTAITAALEGEAERAEPVKTVQSCRSDGTVGSIGSWAVYPRASRDVVVAFKVVIAVASGIDVATCAPANKYRGCVVARRRVSFVPHRNLQIPVELLRACQNIQCDQNSTCTRSGTCTSAVVDTEKCETNNSCSRLSTAVSLPCFNGDNDPVFCGGDLSWCTRDTSGARVCAEVSLPGGTSYQCRNTMDCGPSLKCVEPAPPAGILGTCVVSVPSGATVLCSPLDQPSPCPAGARGCFVDAGEGRLTCGTPPPDGGFPDSGTLVQDAYIKSPFLLMDEQFSQAIALSADGTTLAVGAIEDASSIGGINPAMHNAASYAAGAVVIYRRSGTTWTQEAFIKAGAPRTKDRLGSSVALSADGNTLVAGAMKRDAAGRTDAGAVYVFKRTGTNWVEEAIVTPVSPPAYGFFGWSIALSDDGNTMAVGAISETVSVPNIDGGAGQSSLANAGAAYIFERTAPATWTQQSRVTASNPGVSDNFGDSLALSGDGAVLVVGATLEDSAAAGIDGEQASEDAPNSGAAYVFVRSGSAWVQQAYLKASNSGAEDHFAKVSISRDGTTIAVGAAYEDSSSSGINGAQNDETVSNAGAVYIFRAESDSWVQEAYLKSPGPTVGEYLGFSVGLSSDGNALVGCAPGASTPAPDAGILRHGGCHIFQRAEGAWRQVQRIDASNPRAGAFFGTAVALSADSQVVAVGDVAESGGSPGINTDQTTSGPAGCGAAYAFSRR